VRDPRPFEWGNCAMNGANQPSWWSTGSDNQRSRQVEELDVGDQLQQLLLPQLVATHRTISCSSTLLAVPVAEMTIRE